MERVFDKGEESVLEYADMSTLRKPGREPSRRVALDMSDGTIARLDAFASRYGVTRQSLIKVWLVERMDQEDERAAQREAGRATA
ncbi:type II toxin-antitoxin system BrnA family antitoxin [Thermophilibacter sp.]